MGFLTTFTIYNDGSDLLLDENYAIEFARKLKDAADGFVQHGGSDAGINQTARFGQDSDISLGSFANFCKVQHPRHSDDSTIYVHIGNTLVNVNPYEEEISPNPDKKLKLLYKRNKNFFKKILEVLVKDTKELISFIEPEDLKELVLSDSGICPDKKLPDNIHQELLLKSFDNEENETLKQYLKRFN